MGVRGTVRHESGRRFEREQFDGDVFVEAGRYADVQDAELPAPGLAGAEVGADLGEAEHEGCVRGESGGVETAGVGVGPGGEVDGHDRGAGGPGGLADQGQDVGERGLDGAKASGAEDGVDDCVGPGGEFADLREPGIIVCRHDSDAGVFRQGPLRVVFGPSDADAGRNPGAP